MTITPSGAPLLTPEPSSNPLDIFSAWFSSAQAAGERADAAALATCSEAGPSVRMVLVKGCVQGKLRVFTNYQSRKARELELTGRAAVVFFYPKLDAQIRVEGSVEKLSAQASDEYFASRPLGSQISASVSPQSQLIESHAELTAARAQLIAALGDTAPPRPAHWGGYAITPDAFEFWREGEHRLHHRWSYQLKDGAWQLSLLGP